MTDRNATAKGDKADAVAAAVAAAAAAAAAAGTATATTTTGTTRTPPPPTKTQKSAVLKAAKKILQKKYNGSSDKGEPQMKLKNLVQKTCETITDIASSQVKNWIQKSDKFEKVGNLISLATNNNHTTSTNNNKKKKKDKEDEEDKEDEDESEQPKKKKKKKKRKTESESSPPSKRSKSAGGDSSSSSKKSNTMSCSSTTQLSMIQKWRSEQKIVLVRNTVESSEQTSQDVTLFPVRTFDDCHHDSIAAPLLQQCTSGNGFKYPSPIQAQAWPILAKGYDVVGIAETGSGKTLAFALPALTRLAAARTSPAIITTDSSNHKRKTSRGSPQPRMLVLAPTRELAMQSDEVLQEFGAVVNLQSLVVYGGVPKYQQITALKQRGGVDCLVATPGRLKDLLQEGSCSLEQVEFLVLDEADRMLDMGFEQDVRYIIGQCPTQKEGKRQTCMFSATWPADIQRIAMDFMNPDPIRIYVGFETVRNVNNNDDNNTEADGGNGGNGVTHGATSMLTTVDDSLSANKRVKQIIHVIEDSQRPARLRQILKQVHDLQEHRLLLFCLYKKEAERMEQSLQREGWNCCAIHGNKHQQARTAALQQFKDGSCPLLIATDVAARGLDIPHVQVVINYTFPLTIEDYVHRIGRTGRAGKTGVSYTFFQPVTDKTHAGALQHVLRQAEQDIPDALAALGSTIKRKEHKLYGNFGPSSSSLLPTKQPTKITFESSDEEE